MLTAIQELIISFKNDRMQKSYTKEQMIELLTYKLEAEKQQIIEARDEIFVTGDLSSEEYYNIKFKKSC